MAEKIIKIRPTVAEQSVKNHFPIENANPYIRHKTPMECRNFVNIVCVFLHRDDKL